MSENPIEAWPETLRVLEEAQTLQELDARLVGLADAFKVAGGGEGVEARTILQFLASDAGGLPGAPAHVRSKLRQALERMAASDPTAKALLGRLSA